MNLSAEPTRHSRRWFQFGLRSMFVLLTVVAVFAGWLGSHAAAVQRRNAMRVWIEAQGGTLDHYVFDKPDPPGYVPPDSYLEKLAQYSKVGDWFGDHPVCYVNLCRANVTSEERAEIARLFPEAYVLPADRNTKKGPQ